MALTGTLIPFGRVPPAVTIGLTLAIVLVGVPRAAQPPAPGARAFTNITVVDGTGSPPRPHMTLVIRGARIDDLFEAGAKPLPTGAEVVDMSGRTVIPGLVEAHTHLEEFSGSRARLVEELERMLYGGVVAIREMAADARVSGELNRAARLGLIAGPDIYFAAVMMGPHFRSMDGPGAAIGQAADGNPGWIQTVTPDTDIPGDALRSDVQLYPGGRLSKLGCTPELMTALARAGTIEPGKAADLMILDGDPLQDIRAIRNVHATVKRGRLYPRVEYEARRKAGAAGGR